MARDVQDQMRAELGREAGARPRPGGPRAPRSLPVASGWVVVCFASEPVRFLGRGPGGWIVVMTAERAHRFDSQTDAENALADFQRRHAGATFDASTSWCVKEMKLTATFR